MKMIEELKRLALLIIFSRVNRTESVPRESVRSLIRSLSLAEGVKSLNL